MNSASWELAGVIASGEELIGAVWRESSVLEAFACEVVAGVRNGSWEGGRVSSCCKDDCSGDEVEAGELFFCSLTLHVGGASSSESSLLLSLLDLSRLMDRIWTVRGRMFSVWASLRRGSVSLLRGIAAPTGR